MSGAATPGVNRRKAPDSKWLVVRGPPSFLAVEALRLGKLFGFPAEEGKRRIYLPAAAVVQMVLQVLSDTGQDMLHFDAHGLQTISWPDARNLQDVWRADRARGQDGFLGGRALDLAAGEVIDAGHAPTVENEAQHGGPLHKREIRPAGRGRQIGPRRAAVRVVQKRCREIAAAVDLAAVQVRVEGDARLLAGVDEHPGKRRAVGLFGDHEGAGVTMQVSVARRLPVFGLAEIGQDIVSAPARRANLLPCVVIRAVPAQIDHVVDRARSAEAEAARIADLSSREVFLRRSAEPPVEACVGQGSPVGSGVENCWKRSISSDRRVWVGKRPDTLARIGSSAPGEPARASSARPKFRRNRTSAASPAS